MRFSEKQIDRLRLSVEKRLSEKRFRHTLGVENAAVYLSRFFDCDVTLLRAAALLHDIAKEYSEEELISFIKRGGEMITEEGLKAIPVLHSFAAPYVIKRDFPEFAVPELLSACRNHTIGAPDMSLSDKIIFISDYIEEGRAYESCKRVRGELYSALKPENAESNIKSLDRALVSSMDFTISSLKVKNAYINPDMLLTRNAFLSKI